MSSTESAPVAQASTWPNVAGTALHYLAGAAIVATVGFFAWYGKVSTDLLVVTLTGAAGAVGFKMSK